MPAGPIITRCDYQVSASRLWDAITHPIEMRKWFFESMHSFIPEPGFTTRFNVRHNDKIYIHIWRVKEVITEKKISLAWEYGNYEGSSLVSFELFPARDHTSLQVTHSGTETFPRGNPDFSRDSCEEGWKYLICQRLKQHLDSHFIRVL